MVEQKVIIELFEKKSKDKFGRIILSADCDKKIEKSEFSTDRMVFLKVPRVQEPDATTPIQYNEKNPVDPGARIMLLEETPYQLRFEAYKSYTGTPEFPTIYKEEKNKALVFEKWRIQTDDTEKPTLQGTINFHSYVGKSFFNVKIGENESSTIPFEVRSRKINYQNQYPAMIGDLSETASSLLLESDAPLYQRYDFSEQTRRSYYEDFMFVEYIFKPNNLPESYEYIRRNLYNRLEQKIQEISTCYANSIGPQELTEIIVHSENLHKIRDPIKHWPEEMDGYFPLKIKQSYYEETVDTPENRLVKHFLISLEDLINNIKKNTSSGYIKDQIEQYCEIIDEYLSDDWLHDVSPLQYIPSNSQVLQKREGYRSILQLFLNFEFAFRFEWEEIDDLLKGYNRRLSEMYEYWCYFKLIKVFEKLSDKKINFEKLFEKNRERRWSFNIRRGDSSKQDFEIILEDKRIFLTFWYNKKFSRKTKEYHSYSLPFKPDYSLLVKTTTKNFFIHFDAKYRSEPDILTFYEKIGSIPISTNSKLNEINDEEDEKIIKQRDNYEEINRIYKDGDIYKMHTYKDAILRTEGAYILYPGDIQALFKVTDNEEIPSVGAFPLTPGKNGNEDIELQEFIIAVLKKHI